MTGFDSEKEYTLEDVDEICRRTRKKITAVYRRYSGQKINVHDALYIDSFDFLDTLDDSITDYLDPLLQAVLLFYGTGFAMVETDMNLEEQMRCYTEIEKHIDLLIGILVENPEEILKIGKFDCTKDK